MINTPLVLTSLWTGEQYKFDTARDAANFLGRSHAYLNSCDRGGTVLTQKETREQFTKTMLPKTKGEKNPVDFKYTWQLCADCARASGLCPWSQFLEPIPGWVAIRTYDSEGKPYSYEIIRCPLFVKDAETTEGRKKHRRKLLEE